jgi:DNA invertase Pin-like site-specific DNA recombinase
MALAGGLQAAGIQLELLTGPLTGIYDPNGLGALLFAVLAVGAQLDRDYIRDKTLEGQSAAAARGRHGGRPKVIDDDMLTFALALRAKGVGFPRSPPSSRCPRARTRGSRRRWLRCTARWPRPTSVLHHILSRATTQVRSRRSRPRGSIEPWLVLRLIMAV